MSQTIHPAVATDMRTPERVRLLLTIPTLAGSLDLTMITAFIAQVIFDLGISPAEGAKHHRGLLDRLHARLVHRR